MSEILVRVECTENEGKEPTPLRFFIEERCFVVDEILDCWLASDHRYFKLKANDGHTYILRHDTASGKWELILFQMNR